MDRFFTTKSENRKGSLNGSSTCTKGESTNGKTPADILQLAKKNDKKRHDELIKAKLIALKRDKNDATTIPVVNLIDEEDKPDSGDNLQSIKSKCCNRTQNISSPTYNLASLDTDANCLDMVITGAKDKPSKNSIKLSTLLKNGRFDIAVNRPVFNVCLKVDSKMLRDVVKRDIRVPAENKGFLKNTRKTTDYMELPTLKVANFWIVDEVDKIEYQNMIAQKLKLPFTSRKEHLEHPFHFSANDYMSFFDKSFKAETCPKVQPFEVFYYPERDATYKMKEEVKRAPKDPRFSRLISNYEYFRENDCTQWCDLFRPKTHSAILQKKATREFLYSWINDAFRKLKNVNPRKRQQFLKRQRKKNKQDSEMGDFIVDDNDGYEEDGREIQKDKFIPSLIVTGPIGCGKTSSIYAIVKEELNGSVFELNSSQPRAKKDINFHLKQIGTTHLVNAETGINHDRTVILFDDVDLIDDEGRDKEFWMGASQLLSYTYRPVIFIARDLTTIPSNIIEESTVINLGLNSAKLVDSYLKLVALSKGFDIDSSILRSLQRGGIRGSIMQLQLFSNRFDKLDVGLVKVCRQQLRKLDLMRDIKFGIRYIEFTDRTGDVRYYHYNHLCSSQKLSSDRYQTVSFYSQLLFPSGSRKRKLLYNDAYDYTELNPGGSFEYLSDIRFATEVRPLIKSMAKKEYERIHKIRILKRAGEESKLRKNRRMFHANPKDFFEDLN
ncbi:hypothetical protein HII12_003576 [Brettanomyces bruxellensis]|uniref:AAA+ ATPase domain-containing protein n=1 Tax=Dekkera bruxellensis TaxID=5007 RepID=A0A8H6ETS8_DEKBR|nr:hypothetical protein HII12_003576 [Brettanomyces bruxellensis]